LGLVIGVFSGIGLELEDVNPLSVQSYAKNNMLVTFWILLGFFSFGFLSLYILFGNGFLLGIAISNAINVKGPFQVILGLLPHGIFEVPALVIAGAVSLKSAQLAINKVILKKAVPYYFFDMFIGLGISLVFILIAAVIEAKVTAMLVLFK
jgi:stage II sporulation protein M